MIISGVATLRYSSGCAKYYASQGRRKLRRPIVVVDGVFFQDYLTGITRVWNSLLQEWVLSGFSDHLVLLDRGRTLPPVAGITPLQIPRHDYGRLPQDREMLQSICDRVSADLFISTYYSFPASTPSVVIVHDMISELFQFQGPMWVEKREAIDRASAHIAVSQNTRRDLLRLCPAVRPEQVTMAHCGVPAQFRPASAERIAEFRRRFGLPKPFFLTVGTRKTYKNITLLFKAFGQFPQREQFQIVCVGGGGLFEPEHEVLMVPGSVRYLGPVSDEDLIAAYCSAAALVYPSVYEGFGIPVAEAMACGCPVLTCPNSSIPEVAGDAALYVNPESADELVAAMAQVSSDRSLRQRLIGEGIERARRFSWSKMAKGVQDVLVRAAAAR